MKGEINLVTYYQRKVTSAILFLISGVLFLFSSVLSFLMGNNTTALFQLLVFILFTFDAYIYRRPYVGLGEGKLIINNGLLKKEILLTNVTSTVETKKKLKLTYIRGSMTKKSTILLSMLKPKHREDFLTELQLQLKK